MGRFPPLLALYNIASKNHHFKYRELNKSPEDITAFLLDEKFVDWVLSEEADQSEYWEQWIKDHPEKKHLLQQAKKALLQMDFVHYKLDTQEKISLYADIENKTTSKALHDVVEGMKNYFQLANPEDDQRITDHKKLLKSQPRRHTVMMPEPENKNSSKGSIWKNWHKVAAVLLVFACLASVMIYMTIHIDQNQDMAKVEVYEKKISNGQKLTTYLPDGTKVILNSNSTLRYDSEFGQIDRKVIIEGEAFFEVVKDTVRKFVVQSNGVTSTVLGTSFNIAANSNNNVEVALVTGKLMVDSHNKQVLLLPGESALVDGEGQVSVQDFDYLKVAGWKDGILVFTDNNLPEIIKRLENWYGVNIKSSVSNANGYKYSGVTKNESLDEVLKGISFVYHFNYKIEGNTVRIF